MKRLQSIVFFLLSVDISLSAKILCVFPVPTYSHQKVLRVLPEELAKQGHKVVILTPFPKRVQTENITEIDVSISNEIIEDVLDKHDTNFAISPSDLAEKVFGKGYLIPQSQISHPDVQKLIKYDHKYFDMIIAEETFPTALIFGAKFNAPIVLISASTVSHESFKQVGSEINPLLFPFIQKTPESFWEKVYNFLEAVNINYIERSSRYHDDNLIQKYFGKNARSVEEVRKNVKMLFLSVQHMWDNNRAIGPSVNYMGPIHLTEPRPLQEELQRYLDSSKHGVILMSFGTLGRNSDLPPHIVSVILKVFASLPYDVLWKWYKEDIPNLPQNVRLQKWLPQPQADLLRHPSIKLLINHGGLQSTDEAIAANVPLLGLPLLGGQYHNIQKYQQYGIGKGLDIDNLDEEEFRRTILDVAENETYRRSIRRLSLLLSDQRVSGLQRAVHQIQHLLDHGPLHSPAANISFAEYFMLDVFGPVVLAIFTTAFCVYCTFSRLFSNRYRFESTSM